MRAKFLQNHVRGFHVYHSVATLSWTVSREKIRKLKIILRSVRDARADDDR